MPGIRREGIGWILRIHLPGVMADSAVVLVVDFHVRNGRSVHSGRHGFRHRSCYGEIHTEVAEAEKNRLSLVDFDSFQKLPYAFGNLGIYHKLHRRESQKIFKLTCCTYSDSTREDWHKNRNRLFCPCLYRRITGICFGSVGTAWTTVKLAYELNPC